VNVEIRDVVPADSTQEQTIDNETELKDGNRRESNDGNQTE